MTYADPEEAQARVFLAELERHIGSLMRRRSQWPSGEPNQAIEAELAQIRQQIRNIQRRFPILNLLPPD
ncbi:hypothetical protein ACFROC_04555 [Nocardia tengchongensis]|uniref:hypothetical protein n=1 Tax=Nocardia tengchongensis TaxID=2055889 RepID=UPI0036784492